MLAGDLDDQGRLGGLLGLDSLRPQTLRAPSRLLAASPSLITGIAPELFVSSNSNLSFGFNDGPLWQGRGTNLRATTGLIGRWRNVRLVLAPQYVQSSNRAYQVIPYPQTGPDSVRRSVWANPFHPAPGGIDYPLRMGEGPIRRLDPGQSSLTVAAGRVEFGVSTENVWWGPGMQSAIVLGPQGPGAPSVFVRTRGPWRTRAGRFDAWLVASALRESAFFDSVSANDQRALGGLAVAWRPPRTTSLEVGAARLVIEAGDPSLASFVAPFRSVGRPNGPDSLAPGTRDQLTSFWARWAKPGSGFESWVEWARFEEPASIRDLLLFPGHSQGYTLGLQWARPVTAGTARIWAEASYLEPSPSLRLRPVGASYVSNSVVQGFTNRGQMLGAGTGPGSSSQWIGGDWFRRSWRVGASFARIRWDNAAFFTDVVPPEKREDISLLGTVRAGADFRGMHIAADWTHSVRLNYLYQAYLTDPVAGRTAGIDIVNDALTLTITAPVRRTR